MAKLETEGPTGLTWDDVVDRIRVRSRSREPFDYQSWRDKHFQGMSLVEILTRATETPR